MIEYNKKNLNGWALPEEVFEWLINNIKQGSTILELGSGNGTKELVKFFNVYSVEQEKKWVGVEPKSTYIYSPLKKYDDMIPHSSGWYDVDILKNELPKKYDLLIIDGPVGNNRGNFIKFYDFFDMTVPIIIDDTNRDGDKRMALKIAKDFNKNIIEIKGHEKEMMILI
jgi:hypothetical protein